LVTRVMPLEVSVAASFNCSTPVKRCRTTKVNEVAALIYEINSDLRKIKTGTNDENLSKFRLVPAAEQMSDQILVDLQKLTDLSF
jgi:hypothetical protein